MAALPTLSAAAKHRPAANNRERLRGAERRARAASVTHSR